MIGFLLNTLCSLAPTRLLGIPESFPFRESRITGLGDASGLAVRKIRFKDILNADLDVEEEATLKAALIETSIKLVDTAADMWIGKSSFEEIFNPALRVYQQLSSKGCHEQLPRTIQVSRSHLSRTNQAG